MSKQREQCYLRRKRWYNATRWWGRVVFLVFVALGFFSASCAREFDTSQPTATVIPTDSPTVMPTTTLMPTATEIPLPAPITVPVFWNRVSLGQEFPRDTVTAIVVDPKDPDVLYAGMKYAGIYKSIDGGLSWLPSHHGLSNTQVTSIHIDSQNPNALYTGTMGGVFKSEDGGESWSRIGEGNYLLMDPQDSSHLYARDMENIYESADQGKNWRAVYSAQAGSTGKMYGWAIHPTDGKTLFLIGEKEDEYEASIYESNDGGHTWERIKPLYWDIHNFVTLSVGLDGPGNYYIHWGPDLIHNESGVWRTLLAADYRVPFAATFDSAGAIYFECNSFLCKFHPDEKQRLRLGKPEVAVFTMITISPHDPNTIYVSGEGIAVSKDGGQTWSGRSNGLGGMLLSLETGEGNPPTLYVQQMEEWDDKWWLYNISKVKEPGQPLYISNDGGGTWELATDIGYYLINDTSEQTLYRIGRGNATGDGYLVNWIWRSQDGGKSWTKVFIPGMGPTLTAQGGLLYLYHGIGSWDETAHSWDHWESVSEDYGREWRTLKPPREPKLCYGSTLQFLDEYRPMAIDPGDGNHVFVIDDGRLLESHDSCETTEPFAAAPNTSMNSIAFDPNQPTTLYAGTDSGAYVSFDGGQIWNEINDGLLEGTVVYSIVVDQESNVYAATPRGIFKLEGE